MMRSIVEQKVIGSALLAAAALTAACGTLRPPAESSATAVSREGVQVAVTRQRCAQIVEPELPGADLVEEIVEVQVRNAAGTPVTVHRDAFRLVTPDGFELETTLWHAGVPLTVAGGETRAFELRFQTRGSLTCAREMVLAAGRGVTAAERPVDVGVVRFVPSRTL
jgi:hypothetical protein